MLNVTAAAAAKSLQSCPTLRPHRRQPTRLPHPWDSPGKNTGVGCRFLHFHNSPLYNKLSDTFVHKGVLSSSNIFISNLKSDLANHSTEKYCTDFIIQS